MKRHPNFTLTATAAWILSAGFLGVLQPARADIEFDMSDLSGQPTPTATAQPAVQPQVQVQPQAQAQPTPLPTDTPEPAAQPASPAQDWQEQSSSPAAESAPKPLVAHGRVKAWDFYEAGIKYYKQKSYWQTVVYLKKAVAMKDDPYTPRYIYAEANAMLGVIYQFRIIHPGRAYWYYRAALRYEHDNPTALRHIRQVYPYRNQKD